MKAEDTNSNQRSTPEPQCHVCNDNGVTLRRSEALWDFEYATCPMCGRHPLDIPDYLKRTT